ncbi:MAG: division/cell wall cluster transcriptional repressor MraZ [Lachnospiraceae bacterium]|nr:division/cell wall cluster transcriptional repressor MraZ [Lachnospiraceae bacterium]
MHMFMNTYEHNVDAKGRTVIPSKFREDLGDTFVISVGLDGCAFIYPMDEWINFMKKLQALPNNKAKVRDLIRSFTYYSEELTPDKQGRVVVPKKLREKCNLDGEIIFSGVINKIEVWNKDTFIAKNEPADKEVSIEEIVEDLDGVTF